MHPKGGGGLGCKRAAMVDGTTVPMCNFHYTKYQCKHCFIIETRLEYPSLRALSEQGKEQPQKLPRVVTFGKENLQGGAPPIMERWPVVRLEVGELVHAEVVESQLLTEEPTFQLTAPGHAARGQRHKCLGPSHTALSKLTICKFCMLPRPNVADKAVLITGRFCLVVDSQVAENVPRWIF